MHYFGKMGANDPAIVRDIVETQLIEEFHWLPQDIAKVPYKKLQKLFIIRKQREQSRQTRAAVDQLNSTNQSIGSGKTRRAYVRR